ncbi:MAG: N-acetyltransferase [Planctomycetota bacterium]|nr:MAG: N-acetyltransferase [Planctomycetota bacterium]
MVIRRRNHTHHRPRAVLVHEFRPRDAATLASWVGSAQEAFWLAPRSRPPLTADVIASWGQPGGDRLTLRDPVNRALLAYGEVNPLSLARGSYWLGHLLVDPQCRGRGLGRELTRALLQRAFEHHGARRVTLVVFRDNVAAIACYANAGMNADGYETHHFPAYNRRERLLRMAISVDEWRLAR